MPTPPPTLLLVLSWISALVCKSGSRVGPCCGGGGAAAPMMIHSLNKQLTEHLCLCLHRLEHRYYKNAFDAREGLSYGPDGRCAKQVALYILMPTTTVVLFLLVSLKQMGVKIICTVFKKGFIVIRKSTSCACRDTLYDSPRVQVYPSKH